MTPNVYLSAVVSLAMQGVVGLFMGVAYLVAVPDHLHDDLLPSLSLEIAAQLIQFSFYCLVVSKIIDLSTWMRYVDWFVSTPLMLASTTLFVLHRADVDDAVWTSGRLHLMLASNWIMLSCGLAVELNAIPRIVGVVAGSVALSATFFVMGLSLARDALSVWLVGVTFVVWALYGVAALLDDVSKNVAYNVLDVASKNAFGVFLVVYCMAS